VNDNDQTTSPKFQWQCGGRNRHLHSDFFGDDARRHRSRGWHVRADAAAQAGATYAVLNSSIAGIEQAMNDASGNPSFCTSAVCTASIGGCADGSPKCIRVTANYPYTPLLPNAVYTWASAQNYSSTITLRIQ